MLQRLEITEDIAQKAWADVKLYGDGAALADFKQLYAQGLVSGFTTNPSLMRRAGVSDYESYARELLALVPDMPISFEVIADEFDEMRRHLHTASRRAAPSGACLQ